MNETSEETLKTIERLLVQDLVSPARALEAAYLLGKVDGQMEIARVGEKVLSELTKPS